MSREIESETFETIERDDALTLTAIYFERVDGWALEAGEAPNVAVQSVDLCRREGKDSGTVTLLNGDRILAQLALPRDEFDRLEAWLRDRTGDNLRVFDDTLEQVETYVYEDEED